MPETEITETDVAAPKLRRVTLGTGQKFRVPSSPTISYMFFMRRFLAAFPKDIDDDDIADCYEQTIRFLRRYNDDVDEDRLQESCELLDLITFYNRCYGAEPEDADQAPKRPPRPRAAGSRSSSGSRKPRTASRSRS